MYFSHGADGADPCISKPPVPVRTPVFLPWSGPAKPPVPVRTPVFALSIPHRTRNDTRSRVPLSLSTHSPEPERKSGLPFSSTPQNCRHPERSEGPLYLPFLFPNTPGRARVHACRPPTPRSVASRNASPACDASSPPLPKFVILSAVEGPRRTYPHPYRPNLPTTSARPHRIGSVAPGAASLDCRSIPSVTSVSGVTSPVMAEFSTPSKQIRHLRYTSSMNRSDFLGNTRDYNGKGKWSVEAVQRRYREYCAALHVVSLHRSL